MPRTSQPASPWVVDSRRSEDYSVVAYGLKISGAWSESHARKNLGNYTQLYLTVFYIVVTSH